MKAPVHLNAMRAFEANARHQSFSAAPLPSDSSCTGWRNRLACRCFIAEREAAAKARLVLTEATTQALPDIRAGFDRLSLGLEKLKETSGSRMLTVMVSPALAAK